MVLTDKRNKIILFGVREEDLDKEFITAGLGFFAGHANDTQELFDEQGNSVGKYSTPLATRSFYKIKTKGVRLFKASSSQTY